ncbi:hypothetical protein FUSO5_09265 [Fusobacterium necrophorum BFTR-1]|nr:hypothetical protein FUSO5_09265 [Fusobacterium necrophorum BFTR-1]
MIDREFFILRSFQGIGATYRVENILGIGN